MTERKPIKLILKNKDKIPTYLLLSQVWQKLVKLETWARLEDKKMILPMIKDALAWLEVAQDRVGERDD